MGVSHITSSLILLLLPRNLPWTDIGGFWPDTVQVSMYKWKGLWQHDILPITRHAEYTRDLKGMQCSTCALEDGDQGETTPRRRNWPKILYIFFCFPAFGQHKLSRIPLKILVAAQLFLGLDFKDLPAFQWFGFVGIFFSGLYLPCLL